MLINWMLSTMTKKDRESEHIHSILLQVCSNLLTAKVIRPIGDGEAFNVSIFPHLPLSSSRGPNLCKFLTQIGSAFQPNALYGWALPPPKTESRQITKEQLWSKKIQARSFDHLAQSLYCEEIEKVIKIKSKFRMCTSVAALYTEVRSAIVELEEYTRTNPQISENCLRKFRSTECIGLDKLQPQCNGTAEPKKPTEASVDVVEYRKIYSDSSTQTDDKSNAREINNNGMQTNSVQKSSIPPPPPPPMPSANFVSSIVPPPPPMPMGASIPTPPPMMPSSARADIPNPPPMPAGTNGKVHPTILSSSSSSFCAPPAPPSGLVPPPLPMPSADMAWFSGNTFRKSAVSPPKPMRPLYWTRIVAPKPEGDEDVDMVDAPVQSDAEEELWKEIDETKLDNLDEFTELFSRQTVVPKKSKEAPKPEKVKRIKVLDCKRSQKVGIFARSLHFGFEAIERAIYNCDTSVVSMEILQHIHELLATPSELEKIVAAMQPNVPLDEPEQFLLKMSSISCPSERISCIIFQTDFEEACTSIARNNESMLELCDFLTENQYLKKLFSIILTLGNYMNGGNRMRGQADGFGLEILSKLRDVKSKEPRVTLLHYIVHTYINRYRSENVPLQKIVYPLPNSVDVAKVMSIDFEEVQKQLDELKKKLIGESLSLF